MRMYTQTFAQNPPITPELLAEREEAKRIESLRSEIKQTIESRYSKELQNGEQVIDLSGIVSELTMLIKSQFETNSEAITFTKAYIEDTRLTLAYSAKMNGTEPQTFLRSRTLYGVLMNLESTSTEPESTPQES